MEPVDELISDKLELSESYNELISLTFDLSQISWSVSKFIGFVSILDAYNDIDLTLSGHTHGLQYGIDIGDFRVSPVRLAYKQWADLYELNKQYIYVNRGFGFMGYPGRVGILPEITILELKKS